MQFSDLDLTKTYTYADYLKWTFDERLELIKGYIFKMSPAPAEFHQRISQKINYALYNYFYGKPCEVYVAPFDVRLVRKTVTDGEIATVVQPDICVIAFFIGRIFAQDTVKTNPIIFGEDYLGGPIAGLSGLYAGASLNYQIKNSLLSLRASTIPDWDLRILSPF
ncbi:MAG: Uma2 family endonuclease, partial [Sphingobacteriaceae bacterium]